MKSMERLESGKVMINVLVAPIYYDAPLQVIYLRPSPRGPEYHKGIAFHEYIIDAALGAAFSTKSVMQYARRHGVDADYAIVERFGWQPLNITQ